MLHSWAILTTDNRYTHLDELDNGTQTTDIHTMIHSLAILHKQQIHTPCYTAGLYCTDNRYTHHATQLGNTHHDELGNTAQTTDIHTMLHSWAILHKQHIYTPCNTAGLYCTDNRYTHHATQLGYTAQTTDIHTMLHSWAILHRQQIYTPCYTAGLYCTNNRYT